MNEIEKVAYDRVTNGGAVKLIDFEELRMKDIIFGANWQKEQMLKKSTDMTITESAIPVTIDGHPHYIAGIYECSEDVPYLMKGDKVKVIFIKDEKGE